MTLICLALREGEFAIALLILLTISAGSRWPSSLLLSGKKRMTVQHGWCAASGLVFGLGSPWFASDLPLGLKVGLVAKLLMLFALVGFSAFLVFRLVVFASRADMQVWVSFVVVPMLLSCLATADTLYVASSWICSIFSSLLATFSMSVVTELLASWMAHMISTC